MGSLPATARWSQPWPWGPVSPLKEGTLGYAISTQSPDGVIHLVSSANHPPQHFELNEAWILSDSREHTEVTAGKASLLFDHDNYPDGKPKATWSGHRDGSGRYVLSGKEVWHYSDGGKEYEATWQDGFKTGTETYWDASGRKIWEWEHQPEGTSVWTHYWPEGQKKQESHWRAGRCVGEATCWDRNGKVMAIHHFKDGEMSD